MAFSSPRAGLSISRRVLQQCKPPLPLQPFASPATRSFSRSLARQQEASFDIAADPAGDAAEPVPNEQDMPRWAKTPDRMKAPFSLAIPKDGDAAHVWKINEDPAVLDEFYDRFLGRNGHKLLPEELKWLAVTHKSFDQGRRGFNTRLAHFGRQILVLEAVRFIMASPASSAPVDGQGVEPVPEPAAELEGSRKPFEHPALANVDKLSLAQPQTLLTQGRITRLAFRNRLNEVVRWVPRNVQNLNKSGQVIVVHSALYAIVGALSLQHGAAVASRICRDRILSRLEV
ncbi:hypothetical protein RB595_009433 [Gaeumannomyces hyphopodioides]